MSESSEPRRKIDETIPKMDQKLDDFLEQSKENYIILKKQIDDQDSRLKSIEKVMVQIERPAKWIGWLMLTFMTGSLLYLGERFATWVSKHFH